MTESRKKPGIAVWLIVIAAATLLYVLSSGPAIWLACKGYVPEKASAAGTFIYAPLIWIVEQCPETTQGVYGGWFSFWAPDDWEENFQKELGEAIAKEAFKRMGEDLASKIARGEGLDPTDETAIRTFRLPTKDGALVVTVGDPDADVKVLDAEGKIAITRAGETVPITFTVNPGTHELTFHNGKFEVLASKIELEPGGVRAITATLEPMGEELEGE